MSQYNEFIDAVVDQVAWSPDLTDDEIVAEKQAMRLRVIDDIEHRFPPSVVSRMKHTTNQENQS